MMLMMTTMPLTDLYRVWREVDTDEGVEEPVDGHQLGEPGGPQLLGGVQEVPDEGSLSVLPLLRANLVTAVQHLDVKDVGGEVRYNNDRIYNYEVKRGEDINNDVEDDNEDITA